MEEVYTVSKKQDLELTMAQIMSSLLQNSYLNWRNWRKPQDHSGMNCIKYFLWLYSGSDKYIQQIRPDRPPEDLWMEVHNIIQEAGIKIIPKVKKWKAKWLSEEALQIVEEKREVKSKGERERYILLNAEFQRIAIEFQRTAKRVAENSNRVPENSKEKSLLKWTMPINRGKQWNGKD